MSVVDDRRDTDRDIEEVFGLDPEFFQRVPDHLLPTEWASFKSLMLSDHTAIPNKYKEMIGLAVSGATRCRYCAYFHAEAARMFGATEDEIIETAMVAKHTMGWSTYLNTLPVRLRRVTSEFDQIAAHIREQQAVGAPDLTRSSGGLIRSRPAAAAPRSSARERDEVTKDPLEDLDSLGGRRLGCSSHRLERHPRTRHQRRQLLAGRRNREHVLAARSTRSSHCAAWRGPRSREQTRERGRRAAGHSFEVFLAPRRARGSALVRAHLPTFVSTVTSSFAQSPMMNEQPPPLLLAQRTRAPHLSLSLAAEKDETQ